ncbi:MAG: thiol-disulfide oxidoreductase DCC family protein [Deltaproteobacteria bacterium]|nr:thiol-disulfide oxidoreductase DCC family protein [Deltaproteobacteria bacterium]
MSLDGPILLFDGVCNLCNGTVQWVIAHDPEARIRFASLQSEAGRALVAKHGLPPDAMDTVVLVDGERHWVKSSAALEVLGRVGGAWRLAALLRFVPRPLRDAVYDVVARNRYGWWGKREECWVPTPELRARFL